MSTITVQPLDLVKMIEEIFDRKIKQLNWPQDARISTQPPVQPTQLQPLSQVIIPQEIKDQVARGRSSSRHHSVDNRQRDNSWHLVGAWRQRQPQQQQQQRPEERPQQRNQGRGPKIIYPERSSRDHFQSHERSANQQFDQLVRKLQLAVRSEHTARDWKTQLPNSIRRQLGQVFDTIKPPGGPDPIHDGLARIFEQTSKDLSHLVSSHLEQQTQKLIHEIKQLNQTDRSRAEDMVRDRFKETRVNYSTISSVLERARPSTVAAPPVPTTSTNNRFDALADDVESMEGIQQISRKRLLSDREDTSSPRKAMPPPSTPPTRSATDQPTDPRHRSPPSGTPVSQTARKSHLDRYDRNLNNVQIDEINADTLLIMDSQGKSWKEIPASWEMHVMPGGGIEHADRLLEKVNIPQNIKRIILIVGTNNRCDSREQITGALTRLRQSVDRLRRLTFFVAVPTYDRGTPTEGVMSGHINRTASDLFGSEFIRIPEDFSMDYNSTREHDIHYTPAVASRYLSAVLDHLPKN